MAAPYKQPVSVLVLIHSPDRHILLLERARHPGYWQSVTGSREGSESLIQTAVREVGEETGVAITPEQLSDWHLSNRFEIFEEWRHRYGPDVVFNTEHVYSLCLPQSTPITVAPDEHLGYRWLPQQEAAAAVFSWTNRDAILMLGACNKRIENVAP